MSRRRQPRRTDSAATPSAEPESAPSAPLSAPGKIWLANAPADLLVGCGAMSIPVLAAASALPAAGLLSSGFVFYLLSVFCNNPHYMATIHRAYGSPSDFQKYRLFTVHGTALLLLSGVVALLAPKAIPWIVTLYITWSPWHYSGQNYGIAALFLRRGGVVMAPLERRLLYGAFLCSYVLWAVGAHSSLGDNPYFLSLGIPRLPGLLLRALLLCGFVGAGLAAFFLLWQRHGARGLLAPGVMLFTQGLWFVAPTVLELQGLAVPSVVYFSSGALAFLHCAQYLWVTTYAARRNSTADLVRAAVESRWSAWAYYGRMVLGGLALFVPAPWFLSRVLGRDFVESFFLCTALVNIHHFMLDGAIWKLRDGRIARLLGVAPATPATVSAAAPAVAKPQAWPWWLAFFSSSSPGVRRARWAAGSAVAVLAVVDQGQFLLARGDFGAMGFGLAQRINPQDSRALEARARWELQSGDVAAALSDAAKAVRLAPRGPGQYLLGSLVLQTSGPQAALLHYNAQERMVRPDFSTHINVGTLAAQSGDLARAVKNLEAALAAQPTSSEACLNLAEALRTAGRMPEALATYMEFLRLCPQPVSDADRERVAAVAERVAAVLRDAGQAEAAQQVDAARGDWQKLHSMANGR